jgi:hypothetical protein
MAGEEDARERRIREGRVRKGKVAMTNSARKELEAERPYVPKPRRHRDLSIGGGEGSDSQAHMDYSSQVVDPTPAHDQGVYEEGFSGYDRMEEDQMFYQPEADAHDEEAGDDEGVPEDVVADYMEAQNVIPEGEPERQRQPRPRRGGRVRQIPPYPAGEAPFPGGPQTLALLSDYSRHVANPLWVNHNNVSV